MRQDLQHLKLLSIFHYVVAALMALFGTFPILHFTIGVLMLAAPNRMGGAGGATPPPFLGWLFVLAGGGIVLIGWTGAVCTLLAGRFLTRRKHYLYCLIMAGFICLFHPLGTVLGVFTFIVLLRPSVKRLFENGGLPDEPPDPDEPAPVGDDRVTCDSYDIRTVGGR